MPRPEPKIRTAPLLLPLALIAGLAAGWPAVAPAQEAGPAAMATPEAFRFAGHAAAIWSKATAEKIVQDAPVTVPLMIHPQEPFDEGTYVWDAWPVRTPDGAVAVIDGWIVMVALSAEWGEVESSGKAFYTLSELRYWYTRDGTWRPGGRVFSREEGLGSRQWAGSAVYLPESREVTFFYTAVGAPDAPGLDADPPPRQPSIFNEAIGRPSTVQRLASVTASVAVSEQGVAFEDFGPHRILLEADGFWYDTYESYMAAEAVYGFRDPEYWRNPETGTEHLLFTANAAGVPGPHNAAIGIADRGEDGGWVLRPPLVVSMGVVSQMERPHIVLRDGGLYLFFCTHDFTFSPTLKGYRGLYGFYSPTGELGPAMQPLNGHGLVAANPPEAAEQVYSFMVLPDGQVTSYLNVLWGFAQRPEYKDREMWGAPAPLFGLRFEGATVTVADAPDAPAE